MQFFILFIGVIVFVFFQFVQPPLVFNPVEAGKMKLGVRAQDYQQLEEKHNNLFQKKSEEAKLRLLSLNMKSLQGYRLKYILAKIAQYIEQHVKE